MSYLIRYSDRYNKVAIYKVEVLDDEQKNLSLRKYKLRITYKNEITIVNYSESDYLRLVGDRKERLMSSWINGQSKWTRKSVKVFRRYICWFYPEELL